MNAVTSFITNNNNNCPLCDRQLKLNIDFGNSYSYYSILNGIDDKITFIPDSKSYLDYSLFEYDMNEEKFIFEDDNCKSILLAHQFRLKYSCFNVKKHASGDIWCYLAFSNGMGLSYYDTIVQCASEFELQFFSLWDKTTILVVYNNVKSGKTSISKLFNDDYTTYKVCDVIYNKLFSDFTDIDVLKKRIKKFEILC